VKTNVWCYAAQRRATIICEFLPVPKGGGHQRLTEFKVVDCKEKDCSYRNGVNPENNGKCLIGRKIENPWL